MYRSTLAFVAAVAFAPSAMSQISLFTGPTTTSSVTANAVLLFGDTETTVIGPGWNTTVTLPLGLVSSLTATMPGDGSFTVSGTGVGVAGTVESSKIFAGQTLLSNTTYQLSYSVSNAAAVSLLSGFNMQIGYNNGITTTILVDTSTGLGLAGGTLNLLGLFDTNGDASFNFTTGTILEPNANLYVRFDAGTLVSALNNNLNFDGASLAVVPEPSSWLLGTSALGLLCLRRRRAA